jgi:hypothetical protein
METMRLGNLGTLGAEFFFASLTAPPVGDNASRRSVGRYKLCIVKRHDTGP